MDALSAADEALVSVGRRLQREGYHFITVTPASHGRVNARARRSPPTLRDIFGWSRPFSKSDLPETLLAELEAAGGLLPGPELRCAVRFSSLDGLLLAHTAFPTDQSDAVFFGPDTYRFARAIRHLLTNYKAPRGVRILDVGAGSGAGGLYAARLMRNTSPVLVLSDINQGALRLSRVNAELNDAHDVTVVESDLYARTGDAFDLIISNPPYLVDPLQRLYRHGGGELGFALSLDIAEQGIAHLAPGGRLLLYTGSAIVDGLDMLREALTILLARRGIQWTYEEIDPDVFGEELENAPYDRADRIAVVAVMIERL